MRPFFFIGVGLVLLSAVAWAIRPRPGGDRTPLVWVSDDAPTRRLTIEQFHARRPDLDLRLDPDNGGMEKVIVQSLGGVGPDLFDCYGANQLAAYVRAGIALDVTDDLKRMGVDVHDEAWPFVRNTFELDGRVYGVPANASVDAVFFNKAHLDAAGLAYPTRFDSWADLIALAQKLTVRNAGGRITRYGIVVEDSLAKAVLRTFGGRIFTADGTRCTLDSAPCVAAAGLLHDLIYKYEVAPSPAEQDAAAQAGGWGGYGMKALTADNASMAVGGRWWLLTLRKAPQLRLGACRIPVQPGGEMLGGGKSTLINKSSPHAKEALAFLQFMAGEDYNRVINQEADALGGVRRFATDAQLLNPKFPDEDFHGVFRQAFDAAGGEERSPFVNSAEVDRILTQQLDLVRRDAKSPADAMNAAKAEIDAAMALTLRRDPGLKQRYDRLTAGGAS